VAVKFRERLAESKKGTKKFGGERFNLRKLNELEFRKQFQNETLNTFTDLKNLSGDDNKNRAWESIKETIETSAKVRIPVNVTGK